MIWDWRKTGCVAIAAGMLSAGCGMQLETGYQYRPLTATTAERRGYYAPDFSPEKAAAQRERDQENRSKVPGLQ